MLALVICIVYIYHFVIWVCQLWQVSSILPYTVSILVASGILLGIHLLLEERIVIIFVPVNIICECLPIYSLMFRVFILFLKLTLLPIFLFLFLCVILSNILNPPEWLRDSSNKNEINKQMRLIKLMGLHSVLPEGRESWQTKKEGHQYYCQLVSHLYEIRWSPIFPLYSRGKSFPFKNSTYCNSVLRVGFLVIWCLIRCFYE